jgi:hypothetical protein
MFVVTEAVNARSCGTVVQEEGFAVFIAACVKVILLYFVNALD